jgi:hypothetical protein
MEIKNIATNKKIMLKRFSNPRAYLWKVLGLASFVRMFRKDKVHTNEESFDSPH